MAFLLFIRLVSDLSPKICLLVLLQARTVPLPVDWRTSASRRRRQMSLRHRGEKRPVRQQSATEGYEKDTGQPHREVAATGAAPSKRGDSSLLPADGRNASSLTHEPLWPPAGPQISPWGTACNLNCHTAVRRSVDAVGATDSIDRHRCSLIAHAHRRRRASPHRRLRVPLRHQSVNASVPRGTASQQAKNGKN